jgi:REP element-mobilizing transposase RayT
VTHGRRCLFGEVYDGEMILSAAGKMVIQVCSEMEERISGFSFGDYQVMPNHFHAIVMLGIEDDLSGEDFVDLSESEGRKSLTAIVSQFKSLTTYRYIQGVKAAGWPRFDRVLWQRSFYDHVIRDEKDLESISDYIIANPANWSDDEENEHRINR